jgi:hypothetical protein
MGNRIPWTTPGRAWAYLFLAAGLAVSALANLRAAYIDTAHPQMVTLIMAAAPPVVLFGAIEILTRNDWPKTGLWPELRALIAVAVAVPAAVISYVHLVHLAIHNHAGWTYWLVATLTPLMIDGLLLGCATALLIPPVQAALAPPAPVTAVDPGEGRRKALAAQAEHDAMKMALAMMTRDRDAAEQRLGARDAEIAALRAPEPPVPPVKRPGPGRAPAVTTHTLWAPFVAAAAAGTPWDAERLGKELAQVGDTREPSAWRHVLRRWNEALAKNPNPQPDL